MDELQEILHILDIMDEEEGKGENLFPHFSLVLYSDSSGNIKQALKNYEYEDTIIHFDSLKDCKNRLIDFCKNTCRKYE